MRTFAVIAALAAIVLSCSAARAQAGDASLATDADRIQLARDIGRLIVAEETFGARVGRQTPRADAESTIAVDRQKALLGVDETVDPQALAVAVRAWWVEHVLQPALDVAANPAASCELTVHILSRILSLHQQEQFLGIADETFGDLGNSESILSRAFDAAKERCLAQAFGECMATGNGAALLGLVSGLGRQLQMLGLEAQAETFSLRVEYLFRRCTVYKLIYHVETRTPKVLTNGAHGMVARSVVDGSFTMLFEPGKGEFATRRLASGQWLRRQEDAPEPDVQLTSIECRQVWNSDPLLSCGPGATPSIAGSVWGQVQLRRVYTKQIIVTMQDIRSHNPVIQVRFGPPQTEGQDQVTLDFLPTLLQVPMVVTSKKGARLFQGMTAAAHELLYVKDGGPLVLRLQGWRRDGYPTLFRADMPPVVGAQGARGDQRFELVHRPDLFPPDQINPDLELAPPARPEPPPRIPAQPVR